MENCNILSLIWKNQYDYDLIEEALLVENTFIQQTSRGENLWKAQLGMTKNYVVFLRCDTDFFPDIRNQKVSSEHINLLINMVPVSHLKVRNYSKRKLEVLFPSGSVCYFKLLICSGCGKAWTRWRALERKCDSDILPFVPRSNLISLSSLNRSTQKIIMDQKFFSCFTDLKKYSQKICHSVRTSSEMSDRTRSPRTTTDSEPKSDSDSRVIEKVPESADPKEKPDTKDDSGSDTRAVQTIPDNKKKKKRKTRQVRRFGEGVPENCAFDLTLSYSDEIVANNGQRIKTDEENSGVHELISLEERAAKIMGKSLTESEDDKVETPVGSNNKKKKKRKKKRKFISMKHILNTAKYFTNLSLLIVPDGLRKSKSVDSVNAIPVTNCDKIYITSYASLPNVNDMDFHRRYKRLNYSADYFDDAKDTTLSENHYTHPVSFWLPDKKPEGRIYCTNPVCCREARQTEVCAARLRQIVQNIAEQMVLSDRYYDLKGRGETKQEKEKLSVLLKRILSTSGGAYKPEKSSAISEDSSAQPVVGKSPVRSNNISNVKKKPKKEKTFLDPSALLPYGTAYELRVIQQRMFCEIESPELARYILKPHTVTEVNCPYLCGFLYFFDRLKTLITTEISAQTEVKEAARIYQVFVQIATSCLKTRDEQSAYAIISALCNPIILSDKEFWTYMLQDIERANCLLYLFKLCRKRKKLPTTRQKVPFFLSFVSFIVENLIKEGHKFSSSLTEKVSPWNLLTINSQKNKANIKSKKVFSELRVLSYENYENILAIIEDCRNYFHLENASTKDIATRQYLLYKQFKGVNFI